MRDDQARVVDIIEACYQIVQYIGANHMGPSAQGERRAEHAGVNDESAHASRAS